MSDDLYDGPCEAGCQSFHGGERKHHPDCKHYPHSLTKLHADRIEELEAKLEKAVEGFGKLACLGNGNCYGHSYGNVIAQRYLAELKGQTEGTKE